MKANSRRRVLISSLAMLIVALVALSTATYAWFTQSTESYADGIYVRTTKVSELEIASKLQQTYSTHVAYSAGTSAENKLLMPASTADGTNWFAASATSNTSYAATIATKVTETPADDTNLTNYYFADQLNIHNAGTATCNNVTITMTGFKGDYARVAIVPVDEDRKVVGTFTDYIYDTHGVAYNAATGTDLTKNTTEVDPETNYVVNVGNIEPDGYRFYNIYVWFEGQDVDCVNMKSGQNIPGIKFTVSGTSADDNG